MMNAVEKQQLNRLTHWPDEIINVIASKEEAEIYMKAGLKAARIGNCWALIRSDINWSDYSIRRNTWLKNMLADYDSWKDYNNADLIGEGFPPHDMNGNPYELHHIGQHQDSQPLCIKWKCLKSDFIQFSSPKSPSGTLFSLP